MADRTQPRTLDGRIVSTANRSELAGAKVWFSYTFTDGTSESLSTLTENDGNFSFPLPDRAVRSAVVGSELEGVISVPFDVGDEVMEPGEIVLVVDETMPAFLRFGPGFG